MSPLRIKTRSRLAIFQAVIPSGKPARPGKMHVKEATPAKILHLANVASKRPRWGSQSRRDAPTFCQGVNRSSSVGRGISCWSGFMAIAQGRKLVKLQGAWNQPPRNGDGWERQAPDRRRLSHATKTATTDVFGQKGFADRFVQQSTDPAWPVGRAPMLMDPFPASGSSLDLAWRPARFRRTFDLAPLQHLREKVRTPWQLTARLWRLACHAGLPG